MMTRVPGRFVRVVMSLALAGAGGAVLAGCGGKGQVEVEEPDDEPAKPTAEALLAEARAAAQAGDIDGADAKYQQAYAGQPAFEILDERVRMLIEHGRVTPAVDASKAYYEAQPTDARASHLYAQALIAAGDFATALQVTEELLALDENDAAAHEKRGRALILSGQLDAGLEELRKAVAIEPKNAAFLVEFGSALHRAGRINEAALQLRAAITLDPENGRGLMLLGLALRDDSELEEAEVFLRQATKKMDDARPWFELGIVQNLRGDDLGAEESLAKAVGLEPGNSLYQYAYGEMLRINKNYEGAVEAYRKATELQPPHPKASSKLGLALAEAGRPGEAEVHLTEAIRADASNPYNYFNLGIVYGQQKKWKLGIEMLEKFLEVSDKADGDRGKASDCIKSYKRKKAC